MQIIVRYSHTEVTDNNILKNIFKNSDFYSKKSITYLFSIFRTYTVYLEYNSLINWGILKFKSLCRHQCFIFIHLFSNYISYLIVFTNCSLNFIHYNLSFVYFNVILTHDIQKNIQLPYKFIGLFNIFVHRIFFPSLMLINFFLGSQVFWEKWSGQGTCSLPQ